MVDLPLVQIVLVGADAAHAQAVRDAVCGWPAHAAIENVGDAFAAIRVARRVSAHLVVIDAAVCGAQPGALVRHFERHQPSADVFVFDPVAERTSNETTMAWPWASLPLVLDAWLQLHLHGTSAA